MESILKPVYIKKIKETVGKTLRPKQFILSLGQDYCQLSFEVNPYKKYSSTEDLQAFTQELIKIEQALSDDKIVANAAGSSVSGVRVILKERK